ncbi:ABC transporter substrate-binding protein [Cellulomonas shaoxiangyii]|uniref:ABC transporter substrate-binding protein n=1 Tax=Cellulomonas shaoxiangyii TaxID=2566013 RepID=UPI00140AFCF2|nr:ABC transporter substrate-binding protein [Cellulomonas shaoxiangyii]
MRVVAAGALLLALTAACSADPVDPARAGTVVVAADLPFASLNAGTVAGRAPGSVLVRGLVQAGFVALEPDGTVTPDPSFGTVEKVADAPLTVRYTIAPTARWSDGVPVTPADLLLEWAARSGQLDEVVPELDAGGLPADPAALDQVVAFAATSPALAHASAVPVVDGATVTVVYDRPVADWQLALDVNLPAHVVGRLALDPAAPALPAAAAPTASATATPTPGPTTAATGTSSASTTPTPSADPTAEAATWAAAVTTAVQQQDRAALVPVSRVWRAAGASGDVAADPTLTTTTGPYVLERVDQDGVELVANDAYAGDRAARWDRLRLRTDLDPLAQVDAVAAGDVDVAAPLSTADVLAAAADADGVATRTGGDAVLQLVLQERAGGPFDPAAHADAPDPAAAAAALRAAFVAAVPRADVVAAAVAPLWDDARPSDVVAAQAGPDAPAAEVDAALPPEPDAAPDDAPVTVRLLAATDDPVRARAVEVLTRAAEQAGLDVVPAQVEDPVQALRGEAAAWDAALVPVAQGDLPVASWVARWRGDGAANVTGHADPALDAALDAAAVTVDPAALPAILAQTSGDLVAAGAVLPLVRTPAVLLVADRDAEDDAGLPVVTGVDVLAPARADLTSWWDWARTDG